jgi:hypothetical protein
MQGTQCNENPDFTICEIAIESRPSDPEMIRTIDLTSHQSFGDRDLKVTRTLNIRNAEITICDIALQSQPSSQAHIWTVDLIPYRSFTNRDMVRIAT